MLEKGRETCPAPHRPFFAKISGCTAPKFLYWRIFCTVLFELFCRIFGHLAIVGDTHQLALLRRTGPPVGPGLGEWLSRRRKRKRESMAARVNPVHIQHRLSFCVAVTALLHTSTTTAAAAAESSPGGGGGMIGRGDEGAGGEIRYCRILCILRKEWARRHKLEGQKLERQKLERLQLERDKS